MFKYMKSVAEKKKIPFSVFMMNRKTNSKFTSQGRELQIDAGRYFTMLKTAKAPEQADHKVFSIRGFST